MKKHLKLALGVLLLITICGLSLFGFYKVGYDEGYSQGYSDIPIEVVEIDSVAIEQVNGGYKVIVVSGNKTLTLLSVGGSQ